MHEQDNMSRKGRVPTHYDLYWAEDKKNIYSDKNARAKCQHDNHRTAVMEEVHDVFPNVCLFVIYQVL